MLAPVGPDVFLKFAGGRGSAPQGAGKDLEMAVSRIERRQLGESECHCFRGFLGGTGSWLRVSV